MIYNVRQSEFLKVDPGKAYDNNNYKLIYSCAVVDGIIWPIGQGNMG